MTSSWAIWITGLPGSGKSVLARAAAETLRARGVPVKILEMDVVRKIVTPQPTYDDREREAVYRMLAFMAATLVEAGVSVIIDATAHLRAWRQLARDLIPRFAEVQIECPLAVCRAREAARAHGGAPSGIYAAAGGPRATVPGVDREYERALAPELVIDTTSVDVATGAEAIAALAARLGAGPHESAPASVGWAIWITGRPGSGKTTIARQVAADLRARGLRVWIVEAALLRRLASASVLDGLDDLVHRAVVCLARLLVEAGVAVIVDATGHRRRWREMARELIPRFAEVQLACRPEICADRERAERWRRAGADREAMDIDLVVDYEPSLRPELTIYTDVEDSVTASRHVLFVAERLCRHDAPAAKYRAGL